MDGRGRRSRRRRSRREGGWEQGNLGRRTVGVGWKEGAGGAGAGEGEVGEEGRSRASWTEGQ